VEENAAEADRIKKMRDKRPPEQKFEENAARRAKRAACPLRVAIENRARWEKYMPAEQRLAKWASELTEFRKFAYWADRVDDSLAAAE
jgi:hypothetical protein